MRKTLIVTQVLFSMLFLNLTAAQAQSADCASLSTNITTNTCGTYNIRLANSTDPIAGGCGGATLTTTYDMWFRFTATATSTTISLSNLGSNLNAASTYIQVYSGSCGTLTSLSCASASTPTNLTGLSVGTQYIIRVYVITNPNASQTNRYDYTLCIQDPPSNDLCSNATTLAPNSTCSNTAGTLAGSTASTPAVSSTCAGTPGGDVWYSFTARASNTTISLSSIGSAFSSAGVRLQLFSGSCGALTSVNCVSGTSASLSLNSTTLTPGTTYFVRVYSPTAAPTGNNWNFNICVTDPTARLEFSRSYINVTKGNTGGTVSPGDQLEMRTTLVVFSSTVDSLSVLDTIYSGSGLTYVPGSLSLRTNEGKVYSSFTDALDADGGSITTSGANQVIRMHFGNGSNRSARGWLSNTSRPSVFGGTCIVMVTYRVTVTASFNTAINFRTGALTYRDVGTGVLNNITFTPSQLMVYESPGLCPNAVSVSNAIGVEFGGTFGSPGPNGTAAPFARNRGTSPYTTYSYRLFATGSGPGDNFYGIPNNTSATFTTLNNYAKPDAGGFRVFNVWDITGDHTGAANTARGNPACDTTQPVSSTNPCGYMLVINSAYRADTAFTYTATNLCPNTYYEISAWFKNICYKCGSDSNGVGASGAGYIPTAPGDSSGVYPNIAFDVNGFDYYTTGDIRYLGTTPRGSDSTNSWVKRGFVYLTGPNETSFTLTLRNNAPGGGGNDWALDDISVATCLPNMQYSPSVNPTVCRNNEITIHDTVRSYFNNYNNFKWQRSTDNGNTWVDIAGTTSTASPVWNGSSWQYVTSYTVPHTQTSQSDSGNRYRVVVATVAPNLSNSNCLFTDGVSLINLNVIDCGGALSTNFLAFYGSIANGKVMLNWSTSKENNPLSFTVERSMRNDVFVPIGEISSHQLYTAERNEYQFQDTGYLNGSAHYRIRMNGSQGRVAYSRIIQLNGQAHDFGIRRLANPFQSEISLDVNLPADARINVTLMNATARTVVTKTYPGFSGVNTLRLSGLDHLPAGTYLLQIQYKDQLLTRKLIKQ